MFILSLIGIFIIIFWNN